MHVEKPSATSAAVTAFCATKLEGPGGFLWLDGNGKITAGNGTLDNPKPNAFSLVQIEDCPGATATCKLGCYVHGLQKHAPDTHALYVHNSKEIRRILSAPDDHVTAWKWAHVLADWISANCAGGFRWHVSGDVFSNDYAEFIAAVCSYSPKVRHWIYTRSFEFVPTLHMASVRRRGGNLVINLSADVDNHLAARQCSRDYDLRVCFMSTNGGWLPSTLQDGDVIFPDYALRGGTPEGQAWFAALGPRYKSFVCPVDFHGKAENRRCGPCSRCMV